MPYLKIQTNQAVNETEQLLKKASALVASVLGKPESYVMVALEAQQPMLFAGSNEPLAYLELKSIGLPENKTAEISSKLCALINDTLSISADRVYIEFADAPRKMWGWNNSTF